VILRSISVQGWRCFANPVAVGPFADGLNVLHAPNATGKSTIFEALLRGLLDGHRVSGRDVENLRPWGRALTPTVTVEFLHGGVAYRLMKRFLNRPAAELERREDGGFVRIAEGEAADDKVREILTRNPPGRGLSRAENWGLAQVLWAPQGDLSLGKLSGDVVADTRTALGVQVSGPGSGLLEARIEAAYLRFFTAGGQYKRGKDAPAVVRLRDSLQAAIEAQRTAGEQQRGFEDAARRVEDLRARRAQARRDAEALTKSLEDARGRADAYRSLTSDKAQRAERVKAAEAQHSELKGRIVAIQTAQNELADARQALARLRSELPSHVREVDQQEREAARALTVLEDVRKMRDANEAARQRAELARRYLDELRRVAALDDRLRRIVEASATLAGRKLERSQLVAPEAKTLRAVRKAIKDRDDAQVRLEAALITLEIVAEKTGALVVVSGEDTGERSLPAGVPTQVKGSPEVVVDLPGIARLRARGPAGSIADIRAERETAVQKLKALTETFGTTDLDTLDALQDKATQLDERVAAVQTQLDTLIAGETVEQIEAEHATLGAVVAQILTEYPDWRDSPPDAEALRAAADADKRAFLASLDTAEAARDAAQVAVNAASQQRGAVEVRIEETDRRERSLAAKLAELTNDGKQETDRESELKRIALAWDGARAGLEEIDAKLAEFGVDPGAAVTKLEKQRQAGDDLATKALEQEKSEEGRLMHVSAQGPYSALARADEDVARLEREIASEELRLGAVRLLRTAVDQSRNEALAAVAGPVEAAATRTLQRIAGSKLGRVQLGEAFEPTQVMPGMAASPVAIENMSGGEREQIYLATRLALADVLAKGERQMVVLDDVLVATDAGRLARVMAILEEAAQRLQVLVLTCHPERYRGLDGATFFDLEATLRDVAA
jgi:DNA repair exonuclease SbcCD ATPase subunit